MAETSLPVEVGLEKARREMLTAINEIGNKYGIPSSLVLMILEKILNDSKLNTYTTIISSYDINVPKDLGGSSNGKPGSDKTGA